jgi:ureidoglycolate hydrolase
VVYYISGDNKLQRIENAGKHKKVLTVSITGKKTNDAMPDTVLFNHHKANFSIALHKLERHVDE